jgi:hypothetical protein
VLCPASAWACMLAVADILITSLYVLAVAPDLSSIPDSFIPLFLFALIWLLPSIMLPLVFGLRPFREARARHRARQTGPARVTMGPLQDKYQATWQAGQYVPLQDMLLNLVRVKMITHPPALHFRRKHLGFRQASWHDTLCVPVPAGHEEEAHRLLARFQIETIGAKKKAYAPPEPV